MTDFIVDILSVTPLVSVGDPTIYSQPPTSHIWLEFTVPAEGADGSLTFDLGSHGFNILTSGGVDKRVYAAVKNWGSLRKFMGTGESAVTIEVIYDALVSPTNTSGSFKIGDIMTSKAIYDTVVTFYQWNDLIGAPSAIWTGYWRGIDRMDTKDKICVLSCRVSSLQSKASQIISDVINLPASTTAPSDSLGKMIPRAYGNFMTGVNASDNTRSNRSIFLGYGSRFVEGVVVDQNQASLKLKVRFCQNDGVSSSKLVQKNETSDTPFFKGDFWVWLQGANTYGLIDPSNITVINDANETAIIVDASPTVYIALRPAGVGSQMASGLATDAYKVFDDDAANYVETTSTDYKVGFEIPSVSFTGIQVLEIGTCWHIKGNGIFAGSRDVTFGIWDDFNSPAAGWLGSGSGVPKLFTLGGLTNGSEDRNESNGLRYTAADFDNHVGSATIAEFSEGRFISRDVNNSETPLQWYMQVSSASKDGIRLLSCGLVVKAKIALDRTRRVTRSMVPRKGYDAQGRPSHNPVILTRPEVVVAEGFTPNLTASANQMVFLATGQFQNDPTGVYDTLDTEIRNGAGVAQHLISAVGFMSANTTSGTLGNFTDAKLEDVAGEKDIDVSFGPRIVTFGDGIEELQKRHPIRLHQEDQIWQCVPNDMNPHSSRYYTRGGSNVLISARKHILDGSLSVSSIPFDKLINAAVVNYGHVYGSNRALRTVRYDQYLSQLLFGILPQIVVEEPWITCRDLTVDAEPANFLAKFLGRASARPLLTVNLKLSRDFFDLKRGHVLMFDEDMETIGYRCPAYRCGKLNYSYERSGGAGTNGAFTGSPKLMGSGGLTSETNFFADQQFKSLTFGIPGGGSYTNVTNGWEYYDGTAWNALTNVTRSDGGNPLDVFKASAGVYTVSWDMPTAYNWRKAEFTSAGSFGDRTGPQYLVRMKYVNSTVLVVGTQQTTYPQKWFGRKFEVVESTRKPGGYGDYPYMDVVLQELM